MENRQTHNIMLALLRSIYQKNLITEDVYNHSLNNLPELLDCHEDIEYDVVAKEDKPHGRIPS